MQVHKLHPWNMLPKEAVKLQRQLASEVNSKRRLRRCRLVAAADVSYARLSSVCYAGVVVVRVEDMVVVERRKAIGRMQFPYVPGLLSFREAPVLLEAFAQVTTVPDVILVDGQGIAHPRRFGIASHIGLTLNWPTIGCAKTRLVGVYMKLGRRKGSKAPLVDDDRVIGVALRTKDAVQPVFVSVGHNVDLESATQVVMKCCRGYRLPEPARAAHLYVNSLRMEGTHRALARD